MIGPRPHVTISRRDPWKHELARCGVCGSGVRLELAGAGCADR